MNFSDYIVYVDESGSADVENIDQFYPLLVLSCCVIEKDKYFKEIVPALQQFKFKYCGHDQLVLHEIDIRKRRNGFEFLQNASVQKSFMEDLANIVSSSEFDIVSAVIHKEGLRQKYASPYDPYELALQFCVESICSELIASGQTGRRVCLIFEERGRKEDAVLELAFRRIIDGLGPLQDWNSDKLKELEWEIRFASKKSNSSGLQLADLTARPIGLSVLRPDQPNRAYENFKNKIRHKKVFP